MREGLVISHWQVTTSIAHCFSQQYFLKKIFSIFQKILNERLIIVHNSLKNNKLPKGNTVEKIIPVKDRIEVQPLWDRRTFQSKVLRYMTVGTSLLIEQYMHVRSARFWAERLVFLELFLVRLLFRS